MTPQSYPLIRYGGADDAQLLAELGARTFSETFAADKRNRPEDIAAYLASSFGQAQQEAELTDAHSTFLIAEVDGIAVGYAKLRAGRAPDGITGERPTELVRLYVSQDWHGRGIGAALMRACIDEAKRKGYRTLWLGVWEHNQRARAFYRKWEFQDAGQHVFQLGDDPQTDILMERSVSE